MIEKKKEHTKKPRTTPKKYVIPTEWAYHFEVSIASESARAKVILSCCYLDNLLTQLLISCLAPSITKEDPLFDGPNAPLSTFSSKIELAFRMGMISDENRTSLHLVRKIRNQFAHELTDCNFEDKNIKAWSEVLNKLNDHATKKRRSTFSSGPIGDFEKNVSWLIFWLKHTICSIPTKCPSCGLGVEHRELLKTLPPDKKIKCIRKA